MQPNGTTELTQNPQNHPGTAEKKGFWAGVREWAQIIVIALIIALPIRFFIAEPFIVNGASMDPTFATGQFLVVDRLSYRFEPPARGEVIVFEYPGDPSVYYIKRIIGLPGETVIMQDGKIMIQNDNIQKDTTLKPKSIILEEPYIDAAHTSHDTITEKQLGPTEYFVMGDNRAQSSDSRVWGPLDRHFIIGRPLVRLTPLSKISFLPGQYHAK